MSPSWCYWLDAHFMTKIEKCYSTILQTNLMAFMCIQCVKWMISYFIPWISYISSASTKPHLLQFIGTILLKLHERRNFRVVIRSIISRNLLDFYNFHCSLLFGKYYLCKHLANNSRWNRFINYSYPLIAEESHPESIFFKNSRYTFDIQVANSKHIPGIHITEDCIRNIGTTK